MISQEGLEELEKQVKSCKQCTLYAGCRGKVFGDIGQNTRVIFIGEAPGEAEDKSGRPFVGPAGQLLRQWIKQANILDEEMSILNVVKCRPANNRTPIESERQACGKWLNQQINMIGCNKIVLLGRTACDHFLVDSGVFDGAILKHVGKIYAIGDKEFLVFPHPSFVLRGGNHYKVPIDQLREFWRR